MSTYASNGERPIAWPNLAAAMNVRANADAVPWGQWRHALNVRAEERGRCRRREGWRQFGHQTPSTNRDLWDQHGATGTITRLYFHKGWNGHRGSRMVAATSTDVWMNRADGGWNLLGGGFPEGGAWSFSSNGSLLVGCNGRVVRYARIGAPGGLVEIPSLATIGLTSAAVTWEYASTFFLADVVMQGTRSVQRIVWGNQNSIEFVPSDDSTASFYDLNPGERILMGAQVGTVFVIFTTNGYWRLGIQDGKFAFQNAYYSKEQVGCAVSADAIAIDRGIAYVLASDGIYTVTAFSPSPEWVEWINDTLPIDFMPDHDQCVVRAACFDVVRGEIWWSAPSLHQTLVLDPRHGSSSLIDHAFTALASGPVDRQDDVAMDWARRGVCTPEGLDAIFPPGDRDDARSYPEAESVAEGCWPLDPTCDDCPVSFELVGASEIDGCLKVMSLDYYGRDMRSESGTVTDEPYGCRLVTGSLSFSALQWKRVSRAYLQFLADATDYPGLASLRVGISSGPVDPMSEGCRKVWTFSNKTLACQQTDPGRMPNTKPATWSFELEGNNLYFDLRIEPCTGAPVTLTQFSINASGSPGSTP